MPSQRWARRSYISFDEIESYVEGSKGEFHPTLPLLSLSVLALPSERADGIKPCPAVVASDEATASALRKEMTEEVDEISGTIILKGFPSHLRVITLEADNTRWASGWNLYRKFGDPSTQSGVEDLDIGKGTAGLQGAPFVHHAGNRS